MNTNEHKILFFFEKIYDLKVRNIKQGHGSFLTMEFGKELEYEIIEYEKIKKERRGEWYFWIQMCSWRIDENLIPIAGCEDSRETIENALKKIENKKLKKVEVLNPAFDMKIEFEKGVLINLFSIYTEEDQDLENWILFTPEKKTLTANPGGQLIYESSGE
jgi:hypothetical protein